jgi:hypothetical protein
MDSEANPSKSLCMAFPHVSIDAKMHILHERSHVIGKVFNLMKLTVIFFFVTKDWTTRQKRLRLQSLRSPDKFWYALQDCMKTRIQHGKHLLNIEVQISQDSSLTFTKTKKDAQIGYADVQRKTE